MKLLIFGSGNFVIRFVFKTFINLFLLFRLEWQFRGSGHLHGMLWFKDAPKNLKWDLTEDQIEIIRLYFDHLCVAINPGRCGVPLENRDEEEGERAEGPSHPSRRRFTEVPEGDRLKDLNDLVNSFQRHTRCGAYCLRYKPGQREPYCRFKFPRPIKEKSELLRNDKGDLEFFPKTNDEYMGRFNAFVTHVSSFL